MEHKKDNILALLYEQGIIKDTCKRFCKDESLCQDLTQEVTLILLSKPKAKIDSLNRDGKLLGFIYMVAKQQYCSDSSAFYYKYVKPTQNRIDNERYFETALRDQ
jgi:hypothetical protein